MARLRGPARSTSAPAELPAELCRGNVAVEDFVSASEHPPVWKHSTVERRWWRECTAWRRWQVAVELWGRDNGLDRAALMAMQVWPNSPMWLD